MADNGIDDMLSFFTGSRIDFQISYDLLYYYFYFNVNF